jgi:8-oxo-dGTP diphosphatase
VVEVAQGETVLDGLTREVEEETGLVVTGWDGPVYEVSASAPGMGWHMRVEVYRATAVRGEVTIGGDPDGIVVDAAWVDPATLEMHLAGGHVWVREPLLTWLAAAEVAAEAADVASGSGNEAPHYRYEVTGTGLHDAVVERIG